MALNTPTGRYFVCYEGKDVLDIIGASGLSLAQALEVFAQATPKDQRDVVIYEMLVVGSQPVGYGPRNFPPRYVKHLCSCGRGVAISPNVLCDKCNAEHAARSARAKKAVQTKRQKYTTWPTRAGAHKPRKGD